MKLDEGNGLLSASGSGRQYQKIEDPNGSCEGIIDQVVNQSDLWKTFWIAVSLAMGNAADAVEIMCIGFIMSDMNDLSSIDKELLSSAVFMGMLIGGIVGGYISDYFGRRRILLYCLSINAVAGLISSLVPNVNSLIVCRVVAGLGIGGSVPIVFSLGSELFPALYRGYYISIIASFWMVGAIFVSFVAWIMLGDDFNGNKLMPGVTWRGFAAVSALPALVAFGLTYFKVPESPRYLLTYYNYEEIAKILNSISSLQLTSEDFIAVSAQNTPDPETGVSGGFSPMKAAKEHHNLASTINLLFGKHFARQTIVLLVIWFTLSFGSYGISTWISILFGDVGIGNPYAASFIFALANLPGNVVSLMYLDTVGRRWFLSIGMCLAGISILGFALDTKDAAVVVIFASLFNAFGVMGWNSLDCLSAEIFPTIARSSGMGLLAASGRLGAVAGQFVNGTLEKNIPLLLFVTSACTVVGGVVSWLLPKETAGSSLGLEIDRPVSTELERRDNRSISFEKVTGHSSTTNDLQVGDVNPLYDSVQTEE